MNNIKKSLARLSSLLIYFLLLVTPVTFAMDVEKYQDIEQDSRKKNKAEYSHEYTDEELEKLFKKHREDMKLARKKVEKRLGINQLHSQKSQK